jgi:hypothetical protein
LDRCDIVVTAYRLNAVLPASKALQRVLGLSEAEAAALSGRFPCVVRANEEAEEAERLCLALTEAGALAELREHVLEAPVAKAAPSVAASVPEAPSGYVIGDLAIAAVETPARPAAAPRQPAAVVAVAAPQQVAPAPKPSESAVSGNVQMLDDGFGGEAEHGSALELDYGPGHKRVSKVEVKKPSPPAPKSAAQPAAKAAAASAEKKPAPAAAVGPKKYAVHGAKPDGARRGQINIRDKSADRRGFLATVFLPLVLLYEAAPRFCIALGIVAACGFAAYQVYGPRTEDARADAQLSGQQQGNLLDQSAGAAADLSARQESKPAASLTEAAKDVKVMEWSVASAKRARMRGIRKVNVEWPVEVKPDRKTECMLLDSKYTSKLDDLERTGIRIAPPPSVEEQLNKEIAALQASKRYRGREFVSLCLAN